MKTPFSTTISFKKSLSDRLWLDFFWGGEIEYNDLYSIEQARTRMVQGILQSCYMSTCGGFFYLLTTKFIMPMETEKQMQMLPC
jgi:hypothetical protein